MALIDRTETNLSVLNKLSESIDKKVNELETLIEHKSPTSDLDGATYFLIHNSFAALCELRNNLKVKNLISSSLITRHIFELHADFMLMISDIKLIPQRAQAYISYGEMKNDKLLSSKSEPEKKQSYDKWQKFSDGTNEMHWSGLSRTEVINRSWGKESKIYGILSSHSHSGILTQDLVFWNYSERGIPLTETSTEIALACVTEMFDKTKELGLYGVIVPK